MVSRQQLPHKGDSGASLLEVLAADRCVIEAVLVAAAVVAIDFWTTNDGPAGFGHWFADYMTP